MEVGVAVGVAVGVVVAVGVGVGVAVGLGVGVGAGVDMGPIYDRAITTLSYHFLFTLELDSAWSRRAASLIFNESIERINRFGKYPAKLPSIQ